MDASIPQNLYQPNVFDEILGVVNHAVHAAQDMHDQNVQNALAVQPMHSNNGIVIAVLAVLGILFFMAE